MVEPQSNHSPQPIAVPRQKAPEYLAIAPSGLAK